MNHVAGAKTTAQTVARLIVRSTAVRHAERLAKADAKKIVQADARVVHHRVRQDAEVDAQKVARAVHHVQGATAAAHHHVVDVRGVHHVRAHAIEDVVDVRGVQVAHQVVNHVQTLAMGRVQALVIADAQDVRPLAQALVTMLAQRAIKRRLSPIWAVISASEI